MGAVSADHSFLNTVTRHVIKPPNKPPIIQGNAASGCSECASPHVHAAVTTTHSSRIPVLLTVPCTVIASPVAIWPSNVFSFRTGFALPNNRAIVASVQLSLNLSSENRPCRSYFALLCLKLLHEHSFVYGGAEPCWQPCEAPACTCSE